MIEETYFKCAACGYETLAGNDINNHLIKMHMEIRRSKTTPKRGTLITIVKKAGEDNPEGW